MAGQQPTSYTVFQQLRRTQLLAKLGAALGAVDPTCPQCHAPCHVWKGWWQCATEACPRYGDTVRAATRDEQARADVADDFAAAATCQCGGAHTDQDCPWRPPVGRRGDA